MIMGYKTYEANRDGRLTIYPSLRPPETRKFCRRLFAKIVKVVLQKEL